MIHVGHYSSLTLLLRLTRRKRSLFIPLNQLWRIYIYLYMVILRSPIVIPYRHLNKQRNISDWIRKKVSAVDSNTVPAARVLWPPPWLADWPITHARDTRHTSRVLYQHRTLQPGSTNWVKHPATQSITSKPPAERFVSEQCSSTALTETSWVKSLWLSSKT